MPVVEWISERVLVPQYLPIKGPTAKEMKEKHCLPSHRDIFSLAGKNEEIDS